MKKRIVLIFLSVILVSLCAFVMSACGFFTKFESKSIESMDVVVNSESYDKEKETFFYTYGENIEITKSDFTVTLNYSDGTSETINDYTLYASFYNEEHPNSGLYSVVISYKNDSKTYSESFKVIIERAEYVIDVCDDVTVNYTGEDIDLLAAVDSALEAAGKKTFSELADAGIIKLVWHKNSQYVKNLGTYDVSAFPINNYQSDGSTTVKVTVRKAVVAPPTIKNSVIVYDGNEHAPEFIFEEGTEQFFRITNKTSWSATVNTKYIYAGDYTYSVEPKDGIVEFEGGATSVTLTMTILPAPLTCVESDFSILRTEYVYREGGSYTVDEIENNVDTDIFSLSLSKKNGVSDAGDYQLIAEPKGSYTYADGKRVTTIYFPFTVVPLQLDYSERFEEIAQQLVIRTTYTPDTKVSDFLDGYITDNTNFQLKVNKAVTGYEGGSSKLRTTESDDLLTAGTAQYFIGYKNWSDNYAFSPIPVTLTVQKAELTVGLTYTAADGNPFVYDGEAHVYTASLTGKNANACTLDCGIYRDGEIVETAVDAGTYKLKASISLLAEYDRNYCLTVNGETEYEWEIERQLVSLTEYDFDWTNAINMFEPAEKLQVGATPKDSQSVVEIDDIHLYRDRTAVDGILVAGTYEAKVLLKTTDDNYRMQSSEVTRSWNIYAAQIDLSGLNWSYATGKEFTYGENIYPRIVNVPSYLTASYRARVRGFANQIENPRGVLDAGTYTVSASFQISQIPNADRASVAVAPTELTFTVNRIKLTESDFKCVYRIKYEKNFNDGKYTEYRDYNNGEKITKYMSYEWIMFEAACELTGPECNVVYSIVSSESQLVTATSSGIQHRGKGKVTFSATVTLQSTKNYYFENGSVQVTFTVEIV